MVKAREQLNISIGGESTLARKLHEAEAITGRAKAQIARSVLDTFLETWLRVEETRQQTLAAAKKAASEPEAGGIAVHDIGRLQPPRRTERYHPEPDYWKAVATRRPMPLRMVGQVTEVPVRGAGRLPSRPLQVVSALDDDTGDGGD